MKKLTGVHICMVICSILLSSLGVLCVAIGKVDKRDANDILLNNQNLSLLTAQTTVSEDVHGALTEPTGTSLNNTFTTEGEIQPHTRLFNSDRGTDIYSTTLPVVAVEQELNSPSGKQKESKENGLLTTTITTASPLNPDIGVTVPVTVNKTTPRIPTTNEPGVSKSLEEPFFTKRAEEKNNENVNVFEHPPLSQFNTEEMLTTNPGTNNVQMETESSTVSSILPELSENTQQDVFASSIVSPAQFPTVTNIHAEKTLKSTKASVSLETENGAVKQSNEVNTLSLSTVSEFNEDWDDTKVLPTSQVKNTGHESITSVSAVMPQTVSTDPDPDHGGKGLIFTTPTDVTIEKIEDKVYTGTQESTLVSIAQRGSPADTSGQSSYVSKVTFTEEAAPALSSTDTHDEQLISTPLPGTVSHTSKEENEYKGFMTVSAAVVSVVSELANTLDGTRKQIEETASNTMATPASLASSERTTFVPSVKHFRTTEVYGLEKLESEEGEEEDEEEEEDDDEEEEEDDDEDEEDKDADSMDESVEGDTELPAFTLPVVSSREPLPLKDNQQPLDEISYRVPDTLEWEKQNQGLVRSWMEKLKDKAGYMSGMLVPVGVGIAGALLILGALYIIKIMNRRRRLGFKRHKRKQREFNSMQDRVMLLADSSEDEF